MDRDDSQALIDAVRDACAARSTLYLAGAGSKRTPLAGACAAAPLDVTAHRGIVSYRADELVLTARAGTPVADLVSAAAAQGQRLPFEPLQSAGATLGGTVATGLSGPARPWRGGVRDAVLGLRLINGQAQHLRFGGEVMKNVAGYDVSRLQCGALGAYGVISEVSLRLLPRAPREASVRLAMSAAEALGEMRRLARLPLPLSGACWLDGHLHLRVEGSDAGVEAALAALPPGVDAGAAAPWGALRELDTALFSTARWMLSLAPATPLEEPDPQPLIIDWAGARRVYADLEPAQARALAARGRGSARALFPERHATPTAPAPTPRDALLARLKRAFDPHGVFNPGLPGTGA